MKHHEKKHKMKMGGATKAKLLHGDPEELAEAEGKKRGGKVAHKAHGGKVHHRLDKKARGGKVMTPKSPMSGAAPTKMRPGFSESVNDKEDD